MLLVSMPVLTLAFCSEDANAFEGTYMSLLQASRFYSVRAGTLTIRGPEREILLMFDAAPRNPLLGSWVVDSYQDSTGAVVRPLADTELTAVFRFTKVAGSSGCNTYQGPYTTNESIAAIGPLATTRMACAEEVMAQEAAFLAALQGVGRIEPRADSVMLQDRNGSLLVALVRPSAPEPSPSPSAVAPSAAPSASPSKAPSPSPSPTPTPTAAPTPTPTPVASATPAPTVPLPSSIPPEATCTVVNPATASAIATVVYPAAWFTVAAPPELACRYFDPAAITVPADPTTLSTAVMITVDPASTYAAELAAATDPATWTVTTNAPVTISGLPATRLQATSAAAASGLPGRDDPLCLPDRRWRPASLDRDVRDRHRSGIRHERVGRRSHRGGVHDPPAILTSRRSPG